MKDLIDLTKSERRTLRFIYRYLADNGSSPTLAEIAEGTGIKSRGVAKRYVDSLNDAGFIKVIPNQHRGIRPTDRIEFDYKPLKVSNL